MIARNVVMGWLSNPLKQGPAEELEDSSLHAGPNGYLFSTMLMILTF